MKILTAVRVQLTEGEQVHLYYKGTINIDSYLKVMQGMPYFYRFDRENNIQARRMFEEAITLDPEYGAAYTMVAWTHMIEVWFGLSETPGESMELAVELARKALALDDTQDSPHSLLGNIYLMKRQYEKATAEAERAIGLNPNGADAHAHFGMILNFVGRREEAIALLEKAMRLNPIPPNWYIFSLGDAYFFKKQYEKAIAAYQGVLNRYPDDMRALVGLAATYGLLGREEEARTQTARIFRIAPKFSIEFLRTLPFKNKADTELFIDSMHKAGLK